MAVPRGQRRHAVRRRLQRAAARPQGHRLGRRAVADVLALVGVREQRQGLCFRRAGARLRLGRDTHGPLGHVAKAKPGQIPLDGMNLWPALTVAGAPSPRTEMCSATSSPGDIVGDLTATPLRDAPTRCLHRPPAAPRPRKVSAASDAAQPGARYAAWRCASAAASTTLLDDCWRSVTSGSVNSTEHAHSL